MKNHLRHIAIVAILIFAFALYGCGSSPQTEGTWINPENSSSAEIILSGDSFCSNGLGFPGAGFDSSATGTFEIINDEEMVVTFDTGDIEEYPLEQINGVWALHANKYNPSMFYINEKDLDKYNSANK